MTVRIGLCGAGTALSSYSQVFHVLEVQQTFYEPPQDATMRRWRGTVPPDFEFVVKAWQLITHEARSSTYRRLRTTVTAAERTEVGAFRWSAVTQRAWRITLDCAAQLRASSVLLQCPPSFRPTDENVTRLRRFLQEADRPIGLRLLWEPRGAWPDELVASLCAELELVHATDPFLRRSLTPLAYYRLHGTTGARHVCSDDELETLWDIVGDGPAYVMINNLDRGTDARRFAALVSG